MHVAVKRSFLFIFYCKLKTKITISSVLIAFNVSAFV